MISFKALREIFMSASLWTLGMSYMAFFLGSSLWAFTFAITLILFFTSKVLGENYD
jgi:hypothetical protein